jgi:hypothetical protein
MTRGITTTFVLVGLSLSVAACGRSPERRAVNGGLLGAGAGALTAPGHR